MARKTLSTMPNSKKDVVIQAGSTYTSDSMTDVITIPTANLGFSTRASPQKVLTTDCNIERQPEIAIWPPKPEIVIPLELHIASEFQRHPPIRLESLTSRPTEGRSFENLISKTRTYVSGEWTSKTFSFGSCSARKMTLDKDSMKNPTRTKRLGWKAAMIVRVMDGTDINELTKAKILSSTENKRQLSA